MRADGGFVPADETLPIEETAGLLEVLPAFCASGGFTPGGNAGVDPAVDADTDGETAGLLKTADVSANGLVCATPSSRKVVPLHL